MTSAADALSPFLSRSAQANWRLPARLVATWIRRRRVAKAADELHSLSDRDLHDLRISRTSLDAVARGTYRPD